MAAQTDRLLGRVKGPGSTHSTDPPPVSLGGHHINLMAFFALLMGMFLCKSKSTSQTRGHKEAPGDDILTFMAASGHAGSR